MWRLEVRMGWTAVNFLLSNFHSSSSLSRINKPHLLIVKASCLTALDSIRIFSGELTQQLLWEKYQNLDSRD